MDDQSTMKVNLPLPLDASEQALEEVFRHTPVGVVLTDLHGTILDANRALCTLLAYDQSELIGRRLDSFIHPDERDTSNENLARLREGEVEHVQRTRRYVARDGRVITTRLTASLVHSKDGEPICGIGFVEDIGERMAMDDALRESEHRYRRVVEDQTELIVRCLPDGTRVFVNDAYCRYNDATAEELIGTSFFSCIVEEERELIHRKFASLTPTHPVITDSHHVVDPRGAIRWHEWTDRGFFDDEGRLIEIQAVGRDITEEREAQERLRRSEESFRLLYDSLPVAVWETDFGAVLVEIRRRGLDTPEKLIAAIEANPPVFFEIAAEARIVRANRTALLMTGAAGPDGIREWLRVRYTFDAALAYVRGAATILVGEENSVDIELPLRRPDGRRLDLLQRFAKGPAWPSDPRLVAIALDVTDRRQTERDLVHRKQILEEAELLTHMGSWEWDLSSNQVYGSAGYWRILDGSREARFASLEEALEHFQENDRAQVRETLERMRNGQNVERPNSDRVIVHPDGTTLIARGVAFAERNTAGETVRVYGVLQDLTERRRAEEAARQERETLTRADKMISLGTLVAGVAHEINNPNHAILLNTPLLRDAWKGITPIVDEYALGQEAGVRIAGLPWQEMRGEAISMIDDIDHAATRVAGIVNELGGFARSHDAGAHHPLMINDVVQSSLRLIGNHIRKATSAFSVALMHDLPRVSGNAQRLEQVVINLILNSCQALESEDAMVSVETGRTPSHIFVRVTDGGRGIRREDLLMIKDPFFTTKRAEGGSGLGLAVSERIVQEHGGELTFDSAPGRGTIATLSLPEHQQ